MGRKAVRKSWRTAEAPSAGRRLSRTSFENLARSLFDPYRPELHYMRGPGPKWHAKHDPAPAAIDMRCRRWRASASRPDATSAPSIRDCRGPQLPRCAAEFGSGPISAWLGLRAIIVALPARRRHRPTTDLRHDPAIAARSSTTTRTSPSRWPTGRRSRATSTSRCSTSTSAGRTTSSRRCRASTSSAPCASAPRFPRAVIEKLPDLKLLITTGMRNASIDVAARQGARRHGLRHPARSAIRPPASPSA